MKLATIILIATLSTASALTDAFEFSPWLIYSWDRATAVATNHSACKGEGGGRQNHYRQVDKEQEQQQQ
jgi:hypothetical protein